MSSSHEADFENETFLEPDNITAGSKLSNPLTTNFSTVLHGKSTFKKIVSKIKSWKNKNIGGGNKGGSNKGGGVGIHRPIRPIKTSDNPIMDYIMFGLYGCAFLIAVFIGCLKAFAEESEDEKSKEETEDTSKEDDKITMVAIKNEMDGENKDENGNSEKDKNQIFYITESTSL